MSNFFYDLINPNSGKSHKRVVSLVSCTALITAFVCDIFIDVKVDPVLVDAVMWLALVGMGVSVLEKFAGNKAPKKTISEDTPGN